MPSVLSSLMFFPRGGSAIVARALARRLPEHGWDTTVVSGSMPGPGDAERFYAGLDVHAVTFGEDTPMHPSYEDGADGVFAALGELEYERHVAGWAAQLAEAGAADADVLHLHHLTPVNAAAARVAPEVPVVAHLHGTELLMLERIAEGAPASWRHADAWASRMRAWARAAHTVIVPSEQQRPRVESLLGVPRSRCVVLPNGVDLELFDQRPIDRADHWRGLIDDVDGRQVVLYVGRFTAVKRLDVLIAAWAAAHERFAHPASLVIVGGHPGECEGEHPYDVVRRTGARDVHLAGWQPQEDLPRYLAASDLLVLPSVREQFGLVLVEAMACGVPPIAVDRYGPKEIVEDGRTGWLVEPDDVAGLSAALVAAVNDPAERRRRGANAYETARGRYGWDSVAERLAAVLDEAATPRYAPQLAA